MFDGIAPTYDLLNHLLSWGRDCAWRRRAAERLDAHRPIKVVDLATGTGDLLICLLRRRSNVTEAVGLDVSANMLEICRRKLSRLGLAGRARLVRSDACATPLADGSFDAATVAFGIRNASSPAAMLGEIHRVLRPGGTVLIVEFSLPRRRVMRRLYLAYLRVAVPFIGGLVSRDGLAYRYLNESIEQFCRAGDLVSLIRGAGFSDVSVIPLTFGIASIYTGVKGAGA